ncbi:protein-L-isoaspartate O-methyltransferase family protein [Pseudochelatococcus sp. B33]
MDSSAHPPAKGAEETAAFLLSLRERGISDTALLRAMELAPRDLFAPRRFSDLARADISLPLPCGQTMTAPGIIARMLLALKVAPGQRVFEVGAGSGYVSAVLARLAGEVISTERYRTLALAAAERLATLDLHNVLVLPADGLAAQSVAGRHFERILLNGAIEGGFPPALLAALAPEGILVGARVIDGEPRLLRVTRRDAEADAGGPEAAAEEAFRHEDLGAIRLPPLAHGVAKVL